MFSKFLLHFILSTAINFVIMAGFFDLFFFLFFVNNKVHWNVKNFCKFALGKGLWILITLCCSSVESNIRWNVRKTEAWNNIAAYLQSKVILCNNFKIQWFVNAVFRSNCESNMQQACTIFGFANLKQINYFFFFKLALSLSFPMTVINRHDSQSIHGYVFNSFAKKIWR